MADADRIRWEGRYRERGPIRAEPSPLLVALDEVLPRRGRALDVAGGSGRNALLLARRGLDVTICDISETALGFARGAALAEGLVIQTVALDLETAPLPDGPWDLVLSFQYLQRELFARWPELLAPGGLFVFVQPTRKNLERHPKPGSTFLLDDGELPTLVQGLEVLRHEEGWLDEGRHAAFLVARKAPH
jgi:SAM-dependent methyltransferase